MANQQNQNRKNVDFGTEICKLLPLIIREFASRQKDVFSKGVLSVPQVVILEFLAERGPCQMNELAKVLDCSMSAVTAIVDKMVRLKLVRRERSTEDRRVVNVSILKKGKETARQVGEGRRNCANDLFSALTEEDKKEYIRILKKAYNSLRQRQ